MKNVNQNELEVSLHAAFLMEGFYCAGFKRAIEAWGENNGGCIELVCELVKYAPLIEPLLKKSEQVLGEEYGHPGVFDYEVSSEFGAWFAKHVIANGDVPSEAEGTRELTENVFEFFSQMECADNVAALKAALGVSAEYVSVRVAPVAASVAA